MGGTDRITRSGGVSRRSVLAAFCGSAGVGLAGCSGGEGGDGTTTVDEDNGNGGGSGGSGGSTQDSILPGEVVHDELATVQVLSHWAVASGGVRLRIRNASDSELRAPSGFTEDDPVIQGRTLSPEGTSLSEGYWHAGPGFGPTGVDPGAEATIGFLVGADATNADRYQLCLTRSPIGGIRMSSWADLCGGTD